MELYYVNWNIFHPKDREKAKDDFYMYLGLSTDILLQGSLPTNKNQLFDHERKFNTEFSNWLSLYKLKIPIPPNNTYKKLKNNFKLKGYKYEIVTNTIKPKSASSKNPPTGYHSPLTIFDWLDYYLEDHFEGEKSKKTVVAKTGMKEETIFDLIKDAATNLKNASNIPTPTTPISNSPTNTPIKPKSRLYPVQKKMITHLMEHVWSGIEVFRAAGKTHLVLGLLTYLICENPNIRIGLLSEEFRKTTQRVRVVRKLLETPRIIEDYGFLINDASRRGGGKNTESMFECYRTGTHIEPTLKAITWKDSQSLGDHYDGVVLDDPWSGKLQTTDGAIDKWLQWWGEFNFSMDNIKFVWLLRTRKGYNDLYSILDKDHVFNTLKLPLVKKFPEKKHYEYIEDGSGTVIDVKIDSKADYELEDDCFGKYNIRNVLKLHKKDKIAFEREMQNNPIQLGGSVFSFENIRRFSPTSSDELVKEFYRQWNNHKFLMIMDMSFGTSTDADYNVIYLLAMFKNRLFVIDGDYGRWRYKERLKAISKLADKYPGVPLYIEADFAQISTVRDIKDDLPTVTIRKFISKGKGKKFQELYEGEKKASKKGKIHDALEVLISDERLYVAKDLPSWTMLELQIKSFPNCQYFDAIDTLAMGKLAFKKVGGKTSKAFFR